MQGLKNRAGYASVVLLHLYRWKAESPVARSTSAAVSATFGAGDRRSVWRGRGFALRDGGKLVRETVARYDCPVGMYGKDALRCDVT